MIRIYLRASTQDQNAERARELLTQFATDQLQTTQDDLVFYVENVSGTKLNRPELLRLLNDAEANDVLLVESVDRLSRLSRNDWETLKQLVKAKGLRLVIRDLETTHQQLGTGIAADVMYVINNMLIDLLATFARLDNDKRIERTKQGVRIAKEQRAKILGVNPEDVKFGGRSRKETERSMIIEYHNKNLSPKEIVGAMAAKKVKIGIATVYRVIKETKE